MRPGCSSRCVTHAVLGDGAGDREVAQAAQEALSFDRRSTAVVRRLAVSGIRHLMSVPRAT